MSARFAAWRGQQGAAALAVLLTMVVSRWILLGESFFNQDDFYLSGRAYDADLTLEFLVRDTAGHVNPLQQLAYWLLAHLAPYDWGLVAAFVLVLQTATTVVMWLLLTRLLGERWSRVVLLAVFAWAPITLATTLWWSAAMGLWPHLLCSLLAVWFLVRWHQGDARGVTSVLAIVLTTTVGLLWHERAVLIVPVLFGVAVCLCDESIGWRRLRAATIRYRWLWAWLVLLLAGFLVAHGLLTDVEGGESTFREQAGVTWSFLGKNVVPGFFGGPWAGELEGGAVRPATWVVVMSAGLALVVAALLVLRGGPARRWALVVLSGYVVADLALLISGRAGFGAIIGLDPRYSSDVIHAAVLCAALALRGGPDWLALRWAAQSTRRQTIAVTALIGAYGVAACLGTALLVPHFQNTEDRSFVANLRADLAADPTQVIFDDLAPADVVLPLVGDDSRLSRVFGQLPEHPAFDEPSARMRVVGEDGHLKPTVFAGSVPAVPGPDGECGHEVGARDVAVPFRLPVEGRVLIRIAYFASNESTVAVAAGDWEASFLARRGPNEMWLVLPDVPGPVAALDLRSDGRSIVCVTGVDAGLPER
ncbi:hypothetical protein [Nocardioides sp. WS12]|uniref:hypothetical protein n=1 Tax=Nocardioides sp. WS12 TaxID=2486272 RepID=UPI0015FDAE52|nr:hypothetical protein [Nocardioides sp. WS12]